MQDEIKRIAKELSLPEKVIKKVYKAYWTFIRVHISELPLKEELSEEEFKKLRTSFNLPYLGKLSCTYKRWLNMNKMKSYIKK